MGRTIRIEKRRRGVFGWIIKIIFIAFNILAASVMAINFIILDGADVGSNEGAQAALVLSGALTTGTLLLVWAAGAFILGLFVMLTRGEKVIIEDDYY